MTLQKGTSVGPYEIVAPIGAGGMGEVYRAHDPKLDREVALKVLSADLASSAEHLRRFEQEARAASALNHPNIISIYDIGRSDSTAYIVMELVEGKDLRSLTAEGPLPLKQTLRIASKVADGLAAAHERGIVHRDLKPENVMVSTAGFVKILDFGLAKLVRPWGADDPTVPHTSPGAIFGTAAYMSPEQASGKPTDFRSDQFSFALILYELMTHRRPFERATAPETMAAIIREEAEPPSSLNPAIPPQLEHIVERCLAKNPLDRYGSTRDLARDLREVREAFTNPSHPGRRSSVPRVTVPRRLSPIAAIVAGVLAATGIGYVAWQNYHAVEPAGPKAIAVLPFKDSSAVGANQALADGLSETVSARLAQVASLRVIGPFDGVALPETTSAAEVARRRAADVVLRGTVQHSGDKLRVTFALIDAAGRQVATDSLTGASRDLFTLEDAIAEKIKSALHVSGGTTTASAAGAALQPEDQQSYLEAVGLLQKSRDLKSIDAAIARLEQLLSSARDSATVNATLASAYVSKFLLTKNTALVEQATLYADRALKLDPALPQAHTSAARLALIGGHYSAAIAGFQRSLAMQPNQAAAIAGLAEAYDKMGRGSEAERWYKQAIQARPDHYSPYNSYGGFLFAHGRNQEAAVQFKRVTDLMPDSARGFTNLGAAYQRLGRWADATAAFKRAIAIDPTAATAYSNLGSCEFFLGHYDEAAAALEQATRLRPDDARVWANLGDIYRWTPGRGDKAAAAYDEAIRSARKALVVNANDVSAREILACSAAKRGDFEVAQREIDAALQIDPTNANALYAAAVIASLRGSPASAVTWLSRAIASGYGADEASRDPELNQIRNAPGYREALNATKKN